MIKKSVNDFNTMLFQGFQDWFLQNRGFIEDVYYFGGHSLAHTHVTFKFFLSFINSKVFEYFLSDLWRGLKKMTLGLITHF